LIALAERTTAGCDPLQPAVVSFRVVSCTGH